METHQRPLSLSNPRNEVRPVGTFHWTSDAANTLWLTGWIPETEQEYISTCLGLLIMAVVMIGLGSVENFITAWLRTQNYHELKPVVLYKKKVSGALQRNLRIQKEVSSSRTIAEEDFISIQISDDDNDDASTYMSATSRPQSIKSRRKGKARLQKPKRRYKSVEVVMPWVPPFIWKTEIVRSLLKLLQYFVAVLLIMAVMTGNAAYFVSILAGAFCGEMIFGRLKGSVHRYLR